MMSHRKQIPQILFYTLLTLLFLTVAPIPVQARGVHVYESGKSPEILKQDLEAALNKLDEDNFYDEEETSGFRYHVTNKWGSPFYYDFYIGPLSTKNPVTLLRVETGDGDVTVMERMLELEKVINRDDPMYDADQMEEPGFKYHAISQGLNLVAPWLSVLYQGHHSPRMTSSQMWGRFAAYLIADIFVIGAGGTGGFQEAWNPGDPKNNTYIVAGLVLMRILGSYQALNMTRGHNRVARVGYTFAFE